MVKPKLQAINGVASAEILGGSTFAMRVWLDPEKMASLGITPLDVRKALAANNFTTAAGEVKSDFTQQNINAQTSLETPEQFENLVVATRGDTVIRLGQVATVDLGPENYDSTLRLRRPQGGVHGHPDDARRQPADRHQHGARGHAGNPAACCPRGSRPTSPMTRR